MRLEKWLRFQQPIIEGILYHEAEYEAETVNRHEKGDSEALSLHQIY